MQCSKCGISLEEGTAFCSQCGAVNDMTLAQPEPVAEETPEVVETPVIEETETPVTEPVPQKKRRKILWYLGAAFLVAAVILIVIACRPKPCTSAFETYIAVAYEGDMSKIQKLAPPEYWQSREEDGIFWEQEALRLQMVFLSSRYIQVLECGPDVQVSYETASQEQIGSERMTELKKWAEDEYGISPERITEGYFLKYKLSFSGSKGEQTEEAEYYTLLIDNQWYLIEPFTMQWITYYGFPVTGFIGTAYAPVME